VQTLRGGPQPQDAIGFDPVLFGFTLVLFLGLLFVLDKIAWQPLLASLEEREKRIAQIANEAENVRAEMQAFMAKSDKELAASHDEVRRMLDKVRAEATQESEAMLARAKEDAAAERTKALADIDAAKREALAEVGERSAALAAKMVGKFANRPVDANAVRRHMENRA
jgi:F-type H+-transporting ATPase subunit b